MKNTILNFMRPCSREDAERLNHKILDQVIQESKAEQSKKKENFEFLCSHNLSLLMLEDLLLFLPHMKFLEQKCFQLCNLKLLIVEIFQQFLLRINFHHIFYLFWKDLKKSSRTTSRDCWVVKQENQYYRNGNMASYFL